ncbi:alpha-1,3-mannosyl-glycoprotein 2-beta-N-acetylglucosaminyltransferase [Scaptodrosophila lebanonensis]|uniref:Alpha-1,3-mannosyl-glycoprotein 2-beta-N-acetylglucosaminyltransferase n=1 Tax=Drosophila lebanonensis TaxID=7225 RepID=A0A6J2TIZ1_DROLE|nr:alpha-1,3-mannosyl-glycoprotein 2-beta-N-acetylglucosaminyltransferase [Scaptodrosophila lebanonensis]XP_030375413.1 alpha-1,3-mannosyl-glycoprotein 2-beta-N-acetylglucosaminyltransferase [Scaptodrosophila lebanonensis]
MRSRKVLLVIAFLITWTYITYYILLRSSNPELSKSQFKSLARFLPHAQNENIKSEKLARNLIEFLKVRYLEDQDVPTTGTTPKISIIAAEISDEVADVAEKVTPARIPTQTHLANGEPVIPILVFACNRVSVKDCLENLVRYRPSLKQFPIIVSQDCGDEATKSVIQQFGKQVTLIEQPDQSDIKVPPNEKKFKGYYKISRHYGWALNTTFRVGFDFVVIVEDDLNVAPDFFEYFLGTHKLLKKDPSLWCISAWNDNGKANVVDTSQPELLYRTDFFPGLGWMLTKDLWAELSVKWPKSFWDDWIRHPAQRKERACIRPEISRTRTFGKIGVSNGMFFDKYLKYIKLSTDFVEFTKINMSYLLKENYDSTFLRRVYIYPLVTYDELRRNLIAIKGPVRIQYNTRDQYKRLTRMLGLMDDLKSGVPRTGYHGIVSFFYNGRRVHLAPNANWKGYELSWS